MVDREDSLREVSLPHQIKMQMDISTIERENALFVFMNECLILHESAISEQLHVK